MSDFVADYGEQLRQAAWRQLQTRRRLPRAALSRPARNICIALLALVVAAPAVATTGVWRPLLGDGGEQAPAASDDPVAGSQRAVLSVLRRAQQPADRGPQTTYALRFLSGSVAGVRTNEIRLLHVAPDGSGIVLIPVGRYGLMPPDARAPAGISEALRERMRQRMRARQGSDGLCMFAADQVNGRPDGGGFGCYSTAQLLQGQAAAGLGSRTYGLVPDGVEKIEIVAGGRTTQTVDVEQNFYLYSGQLGRGDRRWLDGDGKLIKTIPGASDLAPVEPPDPARSLCDPGVPRDKCLSGRYAP